ncbi:hypothetical protein D9756_000100 [Leucocoprinus leucothites]|uniref:Uncharacterized protein n=1 Tax=Leucocoprinus leucothites TaxID=201217 RepID=A0A8H5LP25_9AGAR|nr:hypothetical protein D9756_000100 [Leucoagaricus leucothites]
MEGDSRRTSVYDLTGLRVHPDGSRVHQTQRNLRFGTYRRHDTQDFRGWIAEDAGGSIIVPRYKRVPTTDPENYEAQVADENERGDVGEELVQGEEVPEVKGKRKYPSYIQRAIKRKKFAEDDNYISSLPRASETLDSIPQIPSQDLLKNIHHLAASYYDENGLLVNASKRYREAKRLRKLRKAESSSEQVAVEIQSSELGMNDTEQTEVEGNPVGRRRKVNRDMYRVLDGSALVAIGVLTEELVKKLLQGRKPSPQRQEVVSPGGEADGRDGHDRESAESDEDDEVDG